MADETFTQYGFKDDETGKDFVVFSKGAKPKPIAQFEGAIDRYYGNNRKVPEGFIILPQDSWAATGRQLFENVNAPVQKYAPVVGQRLAQGVAPTGFAALGEKLGILKPGAAQSVDTAAGQFGAEEASSLAQQYDTPGKAGLQIGLMGAAKMYKPVTSTINAGTDAAKVMANRLGIAGNIGKATVAGGTTSVLMDAALGEPEPFDPPKVVAAFLPAFATGGLQAGIGVFLNKYVSPNIHEQVATDILKPMADRYPNYKTDPTLFAAAASSPEKLKDMTVAMARGMRGTLDEVADTYKNEITNAIPIRMSVGDQATLRAHLRRGVLAGNDILDNLGDSKAQQLATQALDKAVQDTGKFVADTMKKNGVTNFSKVDAQVAAVTGKLKSDLTNFVEGARVLDAMRQSGQQNGFDPMAFRDILVGKTTSGQQDMMGQVARKLGMGQPLQAAPQVAPPEPASTVFNFLKRHIPGVGQIANMMDMTKGESVVGKLPWQLQQGALPRSTAIGVASQGKEAIDSFMNRKSK